jgi:hypothetical protein
MIGQFTLPPWLNEASASQACLRTIAKALGTVGVMEDPMFSNRSPEIDLFNSLGGTNLGASWCSTAVSAWWRAGLNAANRSDLMPGNGRGFARVADWIPWARQQRLWTQSSDDGSATLGAIVIYAPIDWRREINQEKRDALAHHCGLIVRTSPRALNVEGNTSAVAFSRNGELCALKPTTRERIMGFVAFPNI